MLTHSRRRDLYFSALPQAASDALVRAKLPMPKYILGISAFYHDSAACLLRDGDIAAAAQEERFTRKKHDAGFPKNAVDYCLRQVGIAAEDLDYVAFYDKPLLKFDRLLETYLAFAPKGYASFAKCLVSRCFRPGCPVLAISRHSGDV